MSKMASLKSYILDLLHIELKKPFLWYKTTVQSFKKIIDPFSCNHLETIGEGQTDGQAFLGLKKNKNECILFQ